MTAGRPYYSITPAWRSKPAIKVRAYRFLMGEKATKAGCAKMTGLSRTTVIKWWNSSEWTSKTGKDFDEVQCWICDHTNYINVTASRCAEATGIPLEVVEYELNTLSEIFRIIRGDNPDF